MRLRPVRWVFAGWIAVLCAGSVHALDPNKTITQYIYDHWGADNGFLGGAIYAISQSDDGYLWIGTQRGLVRFDGMHFTLLQKPIPDSPAIGPVVGLMEDEEGNLWIRPEGAGLLVYRNGKFQDAFAKFHLDTLALTAMAGSPDGGMALSALGGHTFRYSHGTFNRVIDPHEVPDSVICMAETRDRKIWFGTRDYGLFYVEQGHVRSASLALQTAKINALFPVSSKGLWSGGLWIGTDRGIFYWDGMKLAKRALPAPLGNAQVLAIIQDFGGNVWVGTDGGLVRISPNGAATIAQSNNQAGNAVSALYEDRYGDIWFGGTQGMQRLRDGTFTTFSTEQGIPSPNNGPVYADSSGRVWFGPISGGLYWFKDGRTGHIAAAGLDHDVVYSISGGNGEIWIGRQHGGLSSLREDHGSFTVDTYNTADGLAGNTVVSVMRSRTGAIWAGTVSAGVSVLKDGSFHNYSVANGLSSNAVNSIVEGSDGTVWVATSNGLDSFSNGRWSMRTEYDGLPSSDVSTIFEDSKHLLWVATSGGLAGISKGRIEIPRNLPDPLREQVFGITEDGLGFLWFSTSDHLLQVDRDQLLSGSLDDSTLQSYGTSDGLPTSEGVRRDRSLVTDSGGRVWVSLSRGIAVADTQSALRNLEQVPAHIDSMLANGVRVDLDGVPRIPAGLKDIAISYSGGFTASPSRIRFRYKLDGASQGWSGVVATRQVMYTNLGPGSYCFRVIASNEAGLWNGPEATIPFVIAPAFWQTLWFRAMCVAVFLLGLYGILFFRTRQIAAQYELRFEERINERTRIARELHDTLLQSFHGLLFRFQAARNLLPRRTEKAMEVLDSAIVTAEQAIAEGRNAIQGLRPEHPRELDFAEQLRAAGEEMAAAHTGPGDRPTFRVIVEGEPLALLPLFQDELYRIVRELLLNAFKHARAHQIEAEIRFDDHFLRIRVRDDGNGIDPEIFKEGKRPGHWGLAGVRERAQMIHATLDFWTQAGAGTEVQVSAPAASAYAAALNIRKGLLGRKRML
jgi:signal transduction histidine kinase/ligand-binding sensor domain-containing protein